MKKLIPLVLGCFLTLNFAFAGQPTDANNKWLGAVEKKVADGQTKVSTPSEERVGLLKEWAGKHGYSVQVNKTETGYQIDLAKELAQK